MGNIFQEINVINNVQSTENQNEQNQFEKRKDVKLLSLKKNLIRENEFKSLESEALTIKKKRNKQIEDHDLIDNCIIKHFFMRTLDAPARLEIIKEMSLAYVPEKTIIFKQGSPGNYFYILKSGKANLIIDNIKKISINVGESLTHSFVKVWQLNRHSHCRNRMLFMGFRTKTFSKNSRSYY